MALVLWLVAFEVVAAHVLGSLRSPSDAALLLAMLLLGTGAGYYGLIGQYWQVLAWFVGLAWYARRMAGYLATVEPVISAVPEPFPMLILLWIIVLPASWMIAVGVAQYQYWYEKWSNP